ncbi:MAG: hypothetical protein WCR52_01655 [Bacteroidota bacterium]
MYRLLLIWAGIIVLNTVARAQNDAALLRDLAAENQKSVDALVLYPTETRLAILEATKYPELLIKMQDLRERTSMAFRTLIEDFPRTTQDVFYDLNRYPGLVESLVTHRNDAGVLRKSMEVMPENKQAEALGVVDRQMPTLAQINSLNQTTQGTFNRLIAGYTPITQQAFEQLLRLPEVIDLLNEDLRFTILVGETYRDNPAWVIQKMDSLNLVVVRTQAEELNNWKSSIESDPAAKSELQAAAKEYADENDDQSTNYNGDDLYAEGGYAPNDQVYAPNYYDPYPYWYGYPYWEPYPRWRPYPWWWDWGWYGRPQGIVIAYMPSYHFMHWYFDHPKHHEHYNHLSTHFVEHYNGHRQSGTAISMGVRDWHERNRTVISDAFLSDKSRLPQRLKEYGQFEQSREDFNARNPKKMIDPGTFLDKNRQKYPDIERSHTEAKAEIQRTDNENRDKRADWPPAKAPSKPEPNPNPAVRPNTDRPSRQEPTPTQRPTRVESPDTRVPMPTQRPKTEQPDIRVPVPVQMPRTQPDAARDYHREQWQQQRPQQVTPRSNPAPATRRESAPARSQAPAGRGRRN